MRADKLAVRRAQRDKKKTLEFLLKKGLDPNIVEEALADFELEKTDPDKNPITRARQGEAALKFLERPQDFIMKVCHRDACDNTFGTTYVSDAYCSNHCRDRDFYMKTGIQVNWGAKTDKERWGGEPPLHIDPVTLLHLAKYVLETREREKSVPQTESIPSAPQQSVSLFSAVDGLHTL